ncbi:hypothetical protein ASD63_09520 [Ensifer sp. Root558]|nr:hypothetical protein ASD63_09520 [Ensifer sp. Root558]
MDLNEALCAQGEDGIRDRFDKAQTRRQPGPKPPRFALIPSHQIQLDETEPEWLIDGLMPKTGFGMLYGPPSTGKTFLGLHAALSIVANLPFFGRTVSHGPVVYIAAEAGRGIIKRIVAARREFEIPDDGDLPFYLITAAPNLGFKTPNDCAELIKSIDAAKVRPALVVIDTVSRTIPGTNENASHEFGAFVTNADAIAKHFASCVLGVHHTGKDATRGMRGSNVANGGTDCEWELSKADGVHTAKLHKMRDDEDALEWTFRLEQRHVGSRTSCVVVPLSEPAKGTGTVTKPEPSPATKLAYEALIDLILSHGKVPPSSPDIPANVKAVTLAEWREHAKKRGISDSDEPDTIRKAFNRAKGTLLECHWIGIWDNLVWTARKDHP